MEASLLAIIANRAEEIGRVAELVRDFGADHGLAPETIHDLCVACDEVLSNIIRYAYKDGARHEISVRLALAGSSVTAEIVDDGVPFDPLSVPPPRLEGGLQERPIGGLGIYFVRKLMDDVRYTRRGDSNVLVLTKRISRAAGP